MAAYKVIFKSDDNKRESFVACDIENLNKKEQKFYDKISKTKTTGIISEYIIDKEGHKHLKNRFFATYRESKMIIKKK